MNQNVDQGMGREEDSEEMAEEGGLYNNLHQTHLLASSLTRAVVPTPGYTLEPPGCISDQWN